MTKEPEIKLFGRRIVFPENGGDLAGGQYSGVSSVESGGSVDCDRGLELSKEKQGKREGEENWERADEGEASVELSQTTAQDGDERTGVGAVEESQNTNATSELDNSPKSPSNEDDNDAASAIHAETENEQSEAPDPLQKKPLKKPDKILPCPRCNSTNTKFCYYNNYNVNQPRYFCRSCQRYWTAGGTMRNVPVGAGRRKNKNLASHCHHIMISEDHPAAVPIDTPDGFRNLNQKPNGTVLSFGTTPLCESMYTAGKETPSGASNGYCKIGQQVSIPSNGQENARDCSTGYSDGGKNMLQPPLMQNVNGFLSPVPCIPGFPWPVPWNSAVPIPTGYILPYYPAPYWSCPLPNAWNGPLLPEPTVSNPISQLGKHSRNGELLKANDPRCEESVEPKTAANQLVVPKTLRINDPEEAAKSSIWTTLGIKHCSFSKGSIFTALQPKADEKKSTAIHSPVLQANPAALSRSIRFRESV